MAAYLVIVDPTVGGGLRGGGGGRDARLDALAGALGASCSSASGRSPISVWLGLNKVLEPHQVDRLVAFDDPEAFRYGAGFHVIQAKAAIGSGGLWGKGFTEGTQTQLAYIPENSTDFVYTIIGEEFGFIGAMLVLVLFAVLLLLRLAGLGVRVGAGRARASLSPA